MQDQTKKASQQEIRNVQRGTGPVHIVQMPRAGTNGSDSLLEAHMSLVRAEQNLYNLIQASQPIASAPYGASPTLGFPRAAQYPAPWANPAFALANPGFVPGFAGATATPQAPGLGLIPALSAWGPSASIAPALSPFGAWPAASAASVFGASIATRTPPCDITDEGKQFVCQLELPGIKADQVELLCFERAVVINASREVDGDIANLVQSERGNTVQQRAIALPDEIRPETCKATLSHGILTIVCPKTRPTEGPRRVPVQG